ncbi:hypothetical protein K788_0003323 [Paraburkholderia caribensis MBA4]|uniref:Uncharacterized protein n=1 Tax=Paraburkholderia caribensis MBA4 TaxID=1323664 RepID=A0A0P0RCH2_9BURK|nr:hypothetical protein K788_0003323 [Paraburkholderia caribensis MBA4]
MFHVLIDSPGRDVCERRPTTRRALKRRWWIIGLARPEAASAMAIRPSLLTGAPASHARCARRPEAGP